MKKALSITLLMLGSGLIAKETTPQDLLPDAPKELATTTAPIKQEPSKTPFVPKQHKPSDLLRELANVMDEAKDQAQDSLNWLGEEAQSFWDATQLKASNVKSALAPSQIMIKEEPTRVLLTIPVGTITPEKDLTIELEKKSFRVEIKEDNKTLQITGNIHQNLLTAQLSKHQERKTKDGASESFSSSNSLVQQTVMGELELDKLSADFTKADSTLTISIPKKAAPEKRVRKVAVNIK